jgi:hypothetical protein
VDAEEAWLADLEDEEPPEEEPEYWEDDELTSEELTAWADAAEAASVIPAPAPAPQPDGGVPDVIGAVLDASGDPALMTDGDLLTSLASWHAVASRAVARELRATEELLRRRRPRVWDRRADRAETRREELDGRADEEGPDRVMPAVVPSREAAAEIALALTATEYSAQAQVELTADLSRRLPGAFAELDAGRADLHRLRVLAEGTQFLTDEDAARVDALLAPRLGGWTTGDLKEKVRRAVIAIDPAAADRRAAHAARKARFSVYANADQTATAAVERMPAQLAAAAKARVNAIARAAKAAGMTDPLPLLEAKIATGLLLDTLPDIPPPRDGGSSDGPPGPADPGPAAPGDDGWPTGWLPTPPAPAGDDSPTEPDDSGADFTGEDQPSPAAPVADDDREVDDRDRADSGTANFTPQSANFTPSDPDDTATGQLNFTPDQGSGPVDFTPPDPGDPPDGEVHAAAEFGWPLIPGQAGRDGPGCYGVPGWLIPKNPGRTRLTVPWRTLTGLGPEPGELSWIGPITPGQARDLAVAAAADPSCTWRLIITDDEGHATAVTTLRTRRDTSTASSPGLVSEVTVTIQQTLAAGLARDGQSRDWITAAITRLTGRPPTSTGSPPGRGQPDPGNLADLLTKAIPAANIAAADAAARAAADLAAGGCAHTMQAPGYRVPDRLRRWLNTRDRICRNPICRRPAAQCDQDHTLAYDRDGRSCTCNLGGLCRVHHQLKQLPGWQLTQDAQGYFTWTTPAGLTYRKEPYRYPV